MTNIKLLAPTYYTRYVNVINVIKKSGAYLNIGCGDGFYDRHLKKHFKICVGVDNNINALRIAFKYKTGNMSYIMADAKKLPFKDDSFDSVICIDVVEHVENPRRLLNEINHLLSPDGTAIVSTPNMNFPFFYDPINFILKPFGKHLPVGIWGFGHIKLFREKEFKKILAKEGLKVIEVRYLTHHLSGLFENYLSDIGGFLIREKDSVVIKKERNLIERILLKFVKIIVSADELMFKNSKTSVGMLFHVAKEKSD